MKRTIAIAIALLAVVPAGAVSGSGLKAKPALKLVRAQPLTLGGLSFKPAERVRVRVLVPRTATRRVSASRKGAFVTRFADVPFDRCSGLTVVAVGSEGSRASLKRPQPACPPGP